MTGGGDLDESADADVDENEAVPSGSDDTSVTFDEYDPDPTAGGSDIGGRAGDANEDATGADDANGGNNQAASNGTGARQGPPDR